MKAVAVCALPIALCVCTLAQAQTWWMREEFRILDATHKTIAVTVVTVDLRRGKLKITAPDLEVPPAQKGAELHSVRSFANELASSRRYRGSEWIVANGGFSSHRVEIPLGLFVANGKLLSTLTRERTRSPSSDDGELRWSGVLCQLQDRKTWDILHASLYESGKCVQALQAGPLLVERGGKPGILEDEPKRTNPYVRLAVCLRDESSLSLVLTQDKTHLLPLSRWLAARGGLGCKVALNLSGDNSAGIAIRASAGRPIQYFGSGTFPVPTMLLLERR